MLISIIIPCYNVQDYIEECVNSTYNQTDKNIEIICINNNSTDSTFDRLQKLKAKFSNLIIDRKAKKGGSVAKNNALSLAKELPITFWQIIKEEYQMKRCFHL